MEKNLKSAIATLLSVLLLFVYLLPYYAPASLADVANGSINGSISDIPADLPPIVLFIVNENNPGQWIPPVMGITSSHNTFSIELSANDGDIILFRINGKDSGTITFNSSIPMTKELQYTPPGSAYIGNSPATPAPFKINTTVTPTATATPLPITPTPAPITNTPTVSAASPSPTATFPLNTIIYAILIGIVLLALLIVFLRKK